MLHAGWRPYRQNPQTCADIDLMLGPIKPYKRGLGKGLIEGEEEQGGQGPYNYSPRWGGRRRGDKVGTRVRNKPEKEPEKVKQ